MAVYWWNYSPCCFWDELFERCHKTKTKRSLLRQYWCCDHDGYLAWCSTTWRITVLLVLPAVVVWIFSYSSRACCHNIVRDEFVFSWVCCFFRSLRQFARRICSSFFNLHKGIMVWRVLLSSCQTLNIKTWHVWQFLKIFKTVKETRRGRVCVCVCVRDRDPLKTYLTSSIVAWCTASHTITSWQGFWTTLEDRRERALHATATSTWPHLATIAQGCPCWHSYKHHFPKFQVHFGNIVQARPSSALTSTPTCGPTSSPTNEPRDCWLLFKKKLKSLLPAFIIHQEDWWLITARRSARQQQE